jgi:hypothetical protein
LSRSPIVPDFTFQRGQVCGSRPCLGGSDALAEAFCREIIVETASSRESRQQLRRTLDMLRADDTLVIYKPDRDARSMKELLVLLEDQPCRGRRRPLPGEGAEVYGFPDMIRATGSITRLYESRDLRGALLRLACEASVDGHARHYPVTKKAVEVILGFPYGCDQDAAVCGPRGVIELSVRPRVVHNCRRCVVLLDRCTGPEVPNQVCHFRSFLSTGSPR